MVVILIDGEMAHTKVSFVPIKGTDSLVVGIVPVTMSRNTVRESRTVTPTKNNHQK